jgi:hypothetical protein
MEKERVMKHLIAAVSLAVFAVPAVAGAAGLPYEQLVIDRTLPNIEPRSTGQSATSGETRSVHSRPADGHVALPWVNDYNFIAPAL